MITKTLFAVVVLAAIVSGCHTTASFLLPPDTELMINNERVTFDSKDESGRPRLERLPFFWSSLMGIEYTLVQGDKVIKKEKLPAEFRIASIFWPPYGFLYWPVGFGLECYDLRDVNSGYSSCSQ